MPKQNARRDLQETDEVFSALAHVSRRQILLVLKHHGGSMTAGEIANRFECSWPTTTRHLRQLETAGLVGVEKSGRERAYKLNSRRIKKVVGNWLVWLD